MHLMQLLQNYFEKSLPNIHAKRINRILMVADSLLSNAKLTLTSLGRNTKGNAQVKNKIKAIDRLLGNKFALQDRQEFYKSMSTKLIGNLNKIDIIVDWSPAGNHENHMLRASFALKGRSMTLYEEVHPQKKLGNYDVHKNFLKILKNILPKNIKAVIITDAGFKTDWFQLVLSYGWDFEGRIFGSMYYQLDNEKTWWKTSTLYPLATKKVKHIANIRLTKNNELTCGIYIYREKSRHKKICKPKKKGTNFAKEIKRYKQQYIQPWLIVTSLPAEKNLNNVIKRYKRRMMIEHEFRNIKNHKWGLGLNETKTRDPSRLSILLLIAAIAMLILWLFGLMAEQKSIHYRYQANTVKNRRVLSLIFLGLQVIKHDLKLISKTDLDKALDSIQYKESYFYAC